MKSINKKINYYIKIRNKFEKLANSELQVVIFYNLISQRKNFKLIKHNISYKIYDSASRIASKKIYTLKKCAKKYKYDY